MMSAHRELLKTAAVDRVNEKGRIGLDLPQSCLDGYFPDGSGGHIDGVSPQEKFTRARIGWIKPLSIQQTRHYAKFEKSVRAAQRPGGLFFEAVLTARGGLQTPQTKGVREERMTVGIASCTEPVRRTGVTSLDRRRQARTG